MAAFRIGTAMQNYWGVRFRTIYMGRVWLTVFLGRPFLRVSLVGPDNIVRRVW